jgi:hypothetical protein
MLSAFLQSPDNDPFRRMQEQRVTVEFLSAVRVSGDTWQVDWRESDWDKGGTPSGAPVVWRAMLRTTLQAPKTAEAGHEPKPHWPLHRRNALGLRAPAHREHRFQRIVNTHSTIVNTPAPASSAMSGKGGDAA